MSNHRKPFFLVFAVLILAGIAVGQPLTGSYDIGGGGNDYATINDAVTALETNGISAAVTFYVYGGDYAGRVLINGPIVGASATDTILFYDASGTARITCAEYLGATDGAVMFDSASYFIFDGIDILLNHPQDSCYKNMSMINGSSYNIIRNATWTGSGFTGTSVKYGLYIWSNECNYNTFENLHITNTKTAVRMYGFTAAGLQPTGNIFRNLTIDNVWGGFYVGNSDQTRIYDCDIQINAAGNTGAAAAPYGIHIDEHQAGDSVFFYRNTVHNIITSYSSGGGLARVDPTSGVAMVYNNMCYDFGITGTGQARGFYTEAGDMHLYFNSIYINDVSATGTD
ncbi:MAG: hypothetical protein ACOZB3_00325, partial [Calditrichota bacterium]